MPPKPSSWATNMRLGVEVHPGERARAERQVVRGREAEVEALEVARGTSRSRRAGGARGRPAARAGGGCSPGSGQSRWRSASSASVPMRAMEQLLGASRRVGAHEHRHVGGHLVVARARGVELAADRARRSRSAAARSPCARPRRPAATWKRSSSISARTSLQPALERREVVLGR